MNANTNPNPNPSAVPMVQSTSQDGGAQQMQMPLTLEQHQAQVQLNAQNHPHPQPHPQGLQQNQNPSNQPQHLQQHPQQQQQMNQHHRPQAPAPVHLDANSPVLFKQHLAHVLVKVNALQVVAMDALAGVENAYAPGGNVAGGVGGAIMALKLTLDDLIQELRSTGVGALPLLSAPPTTSTSPSAHPPSSAHLELSQQQQGPTKPPTEAQLLVEANHTVKVLYDTLKRKQEGAAVVANLLGVEGVRVNTGVGAGRV